MIYAHIVAEDLVDARFLNLTGLPSDTDDDKVRKWKYT